MASAVTPFGKEPAIERKIAGNPLNLNEMHRCFSVASLNIPANVAGWSAYSLFATSSRPGMDGCAPCFRQASEPATAARRSAASKSSPSSRLAAK